MTRDTLEEGTLEEEHNEEEYNEEEDEDFDPNEATIEKEATSSDDSEPEQRANTKRRKAVARSRRKQNGHDSRKASADMDFENSGDEGIIKEGTKQERKRRSRKNDNDHHDEDATGEGLFVKTRSMRAVM